MKENTSYLTPKQAAELLRCTPRNVTSLIMRGKLSASREDGKYYIDKSEFYRRYPNLYKKEMDGNLEHQLAKNEQLEFENSLLKEMTAKKDKEIEFLRNQIELFSNEKHKMLDALVNQTKLLEHQQGNALNPSKKRPWKLFKLKSA